MKRRQLLLGGLALLLASPSAAMQTWPNGTLSGGTFAWTNGGGDPYSGSLTEAMVIAGLTDTRVQRLILSAVKAAPSGNAPRLTITDGLDLGVMVSGRGAQRWAARHAIAYPSRWQKGRSRLASVWYVRDTVSGMQYRLIIPDVCHNPCFDYYGAATQCPCRPGIDAC